MGKGCSIGSAGGLKRDSFSFKCARVSGYGWRVYAVPEVSGPLELELHVVVRHMTWVPGIELESSERSARALNS